MLLPGGERVGRDHRQSTGELQVWGHFPWQVLSHVPQQTPCGVGFSTCPTQNWHKNNGQNKNLLHGNLLYGKKWLIVSSCVGLLQFSNYTTLPDVSWELVNELWIQPEVFLLRRLQSVLLQPLTGRLSLSLLLHQLTTRRFGRVCLQTFQRRLTANQTCDGCSNLKKLFCIMLCFSFHPLLLLSCIFNSCYDDIPLPCSCRKRRASI